ncbi:MULTISPECIES: hypothetical protein [unclassified Blautia]|uniref:hypothetical protein n=1 Tax=unclassified Blautia TaxID=2648079 RepID=UPI003F8874CF
MAYPKMDRYLIFKRKDRNTVEVRNEVYEMSWEMNVRAARFLRKLDGETNPYKIDPYMNRNEVAHLLEKLEEEELLDDGERLLSVGIGSVIIPLWSPKVTRWYRVIGRLWNKILMLCWLPIFFLGVWEFLTQEWIGPESDFGTFYGYLIFAFGILLHELSHVAACLDYGGRFYEMGIMTHYFLPGAYVMITYDNVKNRMKRAQISAGGIESNLLLAGICLCLLKTGWFNPVALLIGAFFNVITAVFNCSLVEGLDGIGIYQEFLGKDFLEKAKPLIRDPKGKIIIRRRGINGEVTIMACYIIVIMQILLPIILLINVFSLVSAFV